MFLLFKTKHIVFFYIFFVCLKHVLNYYVAATFTLDHWACALRHCIAILQCKLRSYRNVDFLLFSRVIR
jgi:hypothetical protein